MYRFTNVKIIIYKLKIKFNKELHIKKQKAYTVKTAYAVYYARSPKDIFFTPSR